MVVIASAGAICLASSQFMVTSLSAAFAAAPPVQHAIRPSYESSLAQVEASALNIASSIEVQPGGTAPAGAKAVPMPTSGTYSVAVEALRVRSGPSAAAPQVLMIKGGRLVQVTYNIKGWFRVKDEAGNSGWAYGSLLTPVDTVAAK